MSTSAETMRIGAAISWSWRMFWRSPGRLLALGVLGFGLRVGFGVLGFAAEFFFVVMRDSHGLTWRDVFNPRAISQADLLETAFASGINVAMSIAVGVVAFLCLQLALSVINLGLIRLSLALASDTPVTTRELFSLRRWPRFVGTSIVLWICIGVGALFCLIGAIVPAIMFAFFGFFIADQNASTFGALRGSWRLVTARPAATCLLLAITLALVVGGRLLGSVIDVFTSPFSTLLLAYGYLHLSPPAPPPTPE
jgi:hypothetical protein